jgi:cell division protein FtsB
MKIDKNKAKNIIILLGVACIVLSIILTTSITYFAIAFDNKDSQIINLQTATEQQQAEIDVLQQQLNKLQNSDVANLTNQIDEKDTQIANLTNQNDLLATEINSLQEQIKNLKLEPTIQEKVRNSVMDYIGFNHPETEQFMNELMWTGGRTTPAGLLGAETYVYTSDGWIFTINYPVVANPVYNVTADYSVPFTGIPYRIIWKGLWQNWCITEDSYVFAQ